MVNQIYTKNIYTWEYYMRLFRFYTSIFLINQFSDLKTSMIIFNSIDIGYTEEYSMHIKDLRIFKLHKIYYLFFYMI